MHQKNKTSLFLLVTILLCKIIGCCFAWEINQTATVTRVIDGDTFDIQDDRVRLADIDAPEEGQPGYSDAKNALSNHVSGKTVYLDNDPKRDPYGRLIAVVYIKYNSTHYKNVNKALLIEGVVVIDNYPNEFNPYTWTLFVRYASPPPSPPPPPPPSNKSPIATINGPYSGPVDEPIFFNSTGSYDPDGIIIEYHWTFGDGSESTSPFPTHTYLSSGTYTVYLTVTDNEGATNSETTTCIVLSNISPIISINGPYSGEVNITIFFSSTRTHDPDGSIMEYFWDFGDGHNSSSPNPTHAYNNIGTYTVTLTVIDNDNASSSLNTTCKIIRPKIHPIAVINGPYKGNTRYMIFFNSTGSCDPDGEIVEYIWKFGDGNISTFQNPSHAYSELGNYTIMLIVIDTDGLIHSVTSICSITNPRGDLIITIRDESYQRLPFVNITSMSQSVEQEPFAGISNINGTVRFDNIIEGNYTLLASKDGYNQLEFHIFVFRNSVNKKEVKLAKIDSINDSSSKQIMPNPLIISLSVLGVAIGLSIVAYYIKINSSKIAKIFHLKWNHRRRKITFTEDKIVSIKDEELNKMEYHIKPKIQNVRQLTYIEENGNRVSVGEWLSEDVGDERRIIFKPLHTINQEDIRIWAWLGQEITKHGKGTISDGGELTVYIPKDVKYSKLISQVSWVFYTILKENKLI